MRYSAGPDLARRFDGGRRIRHASAASSMAPREANLPVAFAVPPELFEAGRRYAFAVKVSGKSEQAATLSLLKFIQ